MISEDADVIAAFLAVGIEVIPPDRDLFPLVLVNGLLLE